MTDRLFVSDISFLAVIGVYAAERVAPQALTIDYELEIDLSAAARSDALVDAPDYHALTTALVAHAEATRFSMLEALAGSILDQILQFDTRIHAATVVLKKPGALANGSVAIQMRRAR